MTRDEATSDRGEPIPDAVLELLRREIGEPTAAEGGIVAGLIPLMIPEGCVIREGPVVSLRFAARKESAIHRAADAGVPGLSVIVRTAFLAGRKKMKRGSRDTTAAVKAIRNTLEDLLPAALLKTYGAGYEVGAEMVSPKTAGDVEGHPFHGNQWTEGTTSREWEGKDTGKPFYHTNEYKRMSATERETYYNSPQRVRDDIEARGNEPEYVLRQEVTVFHGTSSVVLDAIKKEGLKPLASKGNDSWALNNGHSDSVNYMIAGRKTSVYVAFDKKEAIAYAKRAAEVTGGHPVFLEIHLPIGTSIKGDELDPTRASRLREVKPEWIHSVRIQKSGKWRGAESTEVLHAVFFMSDEPKSLKRGDILKFSYTFDKSNPDAVDWADRHAAELIDGISETTREDINNAIASALEDGSIDDAYDEILAAVGNEQRAELIARNETMRAASEGQRQSWRDATDDGLLDDNSKRVWITVGDEKVCPICDPLDGETTDLDGQYPGEGGDGPPAHVNCRCTEGLTS